MEKDQSFQGDKNQLKNIWQNAHQRTFEEVLSSLNVDQDEGLSNAEAGKRLAAFGKNELPQPLPITLLDQFLCQFDDVIVRIMLATALISFFMTITDSNVKSWSAYFEPFIILLMIIVNGALDIWKEMNVNKSFETLMSLQANKAQVLREKKIITINATEVVPGDIIFLHGGDRIPADIRLIKVMAIKVNQSFLTSESEPVTKNPIMTVQIDNAIAQDKKNMVFSTTEMTAGEAKGVVVGTGEFSQLITAKTQIEKAKDETKKTQLKEKLDQFCETMTWIMTVICVLCWLVNFHNFSDPIHGNAFKGAVYYFKISISLALTATPKGLPLIISTCFALSTIRMAANNSIVRYLGAVETLGCTTVICADKSSVITTNQLAVAGLTYIDGNQIVPHRVHGDFLEGEIEGLTNEKFTYNIPLQDIIHSCVLCNDAKLKKAIDGNIQIIGSGLEGALRIFAEKSSRYDALYQRTKEDPKGEIEPYAISIEQEEPVIAKIPFTKQRKSMSVFIKSKDKKNVLLMKGSADAILEKCVKVKQPNGDLSDLTVNLRDLIKEKISDECRKSFRCIAFAIKDNLSDEYALADDKQLATLTSDENRYQNIESDAVFLGYVFLKDPLRFPVKDAIIRCKKAGIKVIMITGDKRETAVAVARLLELIDPKEESSKKVIDAKESEAAEEAEKLTKIKEGACVITQVEPKHKKEIAIMLKGANEVVAMTGDGIGDGTAIKQAQIGISLDITGTDITREAAKLILKDDSFMTIISAIEEARGLYNNVRAFIRYLITNKIGEVSTVFIASVIGFPEVLSPIHMLWITLIADGLPAIAYSFNPPEEDTMERGPRKNDEHVYTNWTIARYLINGGYAGIAAVLIYVHWFMFMHSDDNHSLLSWDQMTTWTECPSWKQDYKNFTSIAGIVDLTKNQCNYFFQGKIKASTLSVTVLILIQMINAINCYSEHSLLKVKIWNNQYLCAAIGGSLFAQICILYSPILKGLFGVTSLTFIDWIWIIVYSIPVLFIDEVIKFIAFNEKMRKLVIKEKEELKLKTS